MPLTREQLEVLEKFRKWLEVTYAKSTARKYFEHVRNYFEFYGSVPPEPGLDDIDEISLVWEFLDTRYRDDNTKNVALNAIRAYYRFVGREDLAKRLGRGTKKPFEPKPIEYDYEEIRKAIDAIPDPLVRAVLCTAYDLALRRSEVRLLRRSDFNPETCEIRVWRVKGKKGVPHPHVLRLSDWCCRHVKEYLKTRSDNDDILFRSRVGPWPVSYEAVRLWFKKYLARILGDEGIRFHQLRHTRITELAEKSPDVVALAKFAGHKSPMTTLHYIHIAGSRLYRRLERGAKPEEAGEHESTA